MSSGTKDAEELSATLSSRLCCASEEPTLTPHQQTWQTTADSPTRRKKALYAGKAKIKVLAEFIHYLEKIVLKIAKSIPRCRKK